MKEKYGITNQINEFDEDKNLTLIQLLNPKFKNKFGESNIEVRNRMKEAILEIIQNNNEKRIAILSHGAAIKFFLQEFCIFDEQNECLKYEGKYVCPLKMKSPSMIKLIYDLKKNVFCEIKYIE